MVYPNFNRAIGEEVEVSDFENQETQDLAKRIKNGEMYDNLVLAKEARFMVESQLETLNGSEELLLKQLQKSFVFFKAGALKRLQLDLQNQIKGAELAKDKVRVLDLSKIFADVSARRNSLEKLF